jgi:hypothetical protein
MSMLCVCPYCMSFSTVYCMSMLHVLVACPCLMFMLHAHAACLCSPKPMLWRTYPCSFSMLVTRATCTNCMSVLCPCFMSLLHVHTACPWYLSFIDILVAFPCCMSMPHSKLRIYPACSCCMSLLHVHAASPYCMSVQHVHAACPCSMSMLRVHDACPCCMSLLHVRFMLYFMSLLLVHAAYF